MKNLKLILIPLMVLFSGGCVKYDIGMTVSKDKSVTVELISAIESTYSTYGDTDSDGEVAEKKGYTVETYDDGTYVGIKATKTYENIDDISTTDEITVELSEVLDEDSDDIAYFFQKKTSLFKTEYVANFTIDMTDLADMEDYTSTMELTYHATLPSRATSNNATSVEGKTYTWDLTPGEVNSIEYSFTVSRVNFLLLIVILIIIVAAIVFILKKKKNDNSALNTTTTPNIQNNEPVQSSTTDNLHN